jgi:hypothetical protein
VKNQRRALRRAARRGVEKVRRVAAAAFQPDLFVAQPGFLLLRIEQLGAHQGRGGRHETVGPVLRQLPERHLTERQLFSAQEQFLVWDFFDWRHNNWDTDTRQKYTPYSGVS